MDTTPDTAPPAAPQLPSEVSAALAACAAELGKLTAAITAADLPVHPDLNPLHQQLADAELAALRSVARHQLTAAGMAGEPKWHELGDIYDTVGEAWAVEVLEGDDRCPQVALNAPSAPEANRRAVTWANREAELPEVIPVDSVAARLAGYGTVEVSPGRWRVTIEGW